MRGIRRVALNGRPQRYLARKQLEVNAGSDCRKSWETARKTKTMGEVVDTLARMSGDRQRCMFCEDSRGTQVDHFWPMVPYKQRAFLWENLLWVCSGCNQAKGNRFDLDPDGKPLLIDPTAEDPWDYLFFEPGTGLITARFHADTGTSDPKGEHTADDAILPLNIEAVAEGRKRVSRSLHRAVQRFLTGLSERRDPPELQRELLEEIRDHEHYGLVQWYFLRDGSCLPPFSKLRNGHPGVWQSIVDEISQ